MDAKYQGIMVGLSARFQVVVVNGKRNRLSTVKFLVTLFHWMILRATVQKLVDTSTTQIHAVISVLHQRA